MSCFRPLSMCRLDDGTVKCGSLPDGRWFEVPCGKCVGCKMDRARAWSIRITHEAQLYDTNWMATFTYREDAVPKSLSLQYPDFQKFMKRLRKKIKGERVGPEGGFPLRFFCAGEYGGKTGRPHYHAVLFNCRIGDERPWDNGQYWSAKLEELWSYGHVVLDSVTPASAAYVAGYTQKKVYGVSEKSRYEDVVNLRTGELTSRRPEFVVMSLKPGIGAWWYARFAKDLFPKDHAIVAGGKRWKVPRYYWEKFRLEADPAVVEAIETDRFLRAMDREADSTPERRAVREEVAQARVNLLQERGL